ncbi:MAG: 3-methyl-2-oxobutanoate dehydrogenase subunit VorB [Spirochaetales bacterium]|nr:3-methyl-2-oxobutanoate dehydrogenase subunit VorB [Spirochaetales bacterium]
MKSFLKGNEAVVMGSLLAGCQSYYGYPITPASEITHAAANYFPQLSRTFLQAESEVAAINMVYGAAAAGERTMTASSGPGISLMCEGLSYIAACELPCLIVDIMRAGPGLGNIGPEQSDYYQLTKGGGHGNYNTLVLAPNSVQEMLDFAIIGFELADNYRIPVIIAADGVIGQMMEPVTLPDPVKNIPEKEWALTGDKRAEYNLHTSIFLDHDQLEEVNLRLDRKHRQIMANEQLFESYRADDAEIILVGYGIVSRQLKALVNQVRKQGIKAGLIRPITLWPFPSKAFEEIRNYKALRKVIVAEMSNGQLFWDVKAALDNSSLEISLINRMGGNLIEDQDLLKEITNS